MLWWKRRKHEAALAAAAGVKPGQIVTNGVITGRLVRLEGEEIRVDAVVEYRRPGSGRLTQVTLPADGRYDMPLWHAVPEEAKAGGFLWRRMIQALR